VKNAALCILLALMACGQTAPRAGDSASGIIIEQDGYFALPGKAEEVYQWRIHACDVMEKMGLPRGRVFRRYGNSDTLPGVIWQMEYPDDAARQRSLKIRLDSVDFTEVRQHMGTLIRRADVGVWGEKR
jgi:hypothetical protein